MDRFFSRFHPRPDDPVVGASFVPGPPQGPPYHPRWWLHILLFTLTLISTTMIGGLFWGNLPAEMVEIPFLQLLLDPRLLTAGLWFALLSVQ
ncbi:MAG: hypothetical protein K8R59_02435 [Thermoanaerobaculales bacterium]|nr:hypothetical protein [Thermoanaerobaculales bacterium]